MQHSPSRRQILRRLALGAAATPLAAAAVRAWAASQALLSPASQAAHKVNYVEDAKSAKGASAGSSCANCALYQGANGSSQGPCQLFPSNDVKAAGWCSSWAAQM
jgi:anaerobic selenocysteine-containing dehydrogenase